MTHTCFSYVIRVVLPLLFVTFSSTAGAQIVDNNNIHFYSATPHETLGIVACSTTSGSGQLGQLSLQGQPSYPVPGAIFSPLAPSISDRIAEARTKYNRASRATKQKKGKNSRRGKKNAKSKAKKKRIARARADVTSLENLSAWCASMQSPVSQQPGSQQPGSQEPGSQDPSPQQPGWQDPGTLPPSDGGFPGSDPGDVEEPEFETELAGPTHLRSSAYVSGVITGGGMARVTLGNDSWLRTVESTNGSFQFGPLPAGTYFLRAEEKGMSYGPSHTVVIGSEGGSEPIVLEARAVPNDGYRFHWHDEAVSRAGHEYATATSGDTARETSGGEAPDGSAAQVLLEKYGVTLASDGAAWSNEHTDRLLKTFVNVWNDEWGTMPVQKPSTWTLSSADIRDDVEITQHEDRIAVRIMEDAFAYAAPRAAEIDGVRGVFFSQRLFKAVARFVTSSGRDAAAVDQILRNRFNVSTIIPDPYWLTYATTREGSESFQEFSPSELIWILGTFAELPDGLNKSDYPLPLLRRKNSVAHPKFPKAKLVTWVGESPWSSYMELMQGAFFDDPKTILRNMIGGKAAILWKHHLSSALRGQWVEVGGWYQDTDGGWNTTNPTEVGEILVGDLKPSPQKDFAASVAAYIVTPRELEFRSPARFEFLKLYVMHGYRYLNQIPEDLQFEVLNLRPDYSYPGKINAVDIRVTGAPEEDKQVTIRLRLEGDDLLNDGAAYGMTTMVNQRTGETMGITFQPVRPDYATGLSLELEARFTMSRYKSAGFWQPDRIFLWDAVDNMRAQNRDSFGWKLYIDNVLRAPAAPTLREGTLSFTLGVGSSNGIPVPRLAVRFEVENPEMLAYACGQVRSLDRNGPGTSGCAWSADGSSTVEIEMLLNPYTPTDRFGLYSLTLSSNHSDNEYYFSTEPQPGEPEMPIVELFSPDGDETPPEIDIDSVVITARPTNPDAPDGETVVVIRAKAMDDKSGFRSITFCLTSPIDRTTCKGVDDPDFWDLVGTRADGEWKEYALTWTLPIGSAPGQWGLSQVSLSDKAGNYSWRSLTEIIHFRVEGD